MPTVESDVDAERVLFSYGFGTSVPSTSRKRMQQRSVECVAGTCRKKVGGWEVYRSSQGQRLSLLSRAYEYVYPNKTEQYMYMYVG